MILSDRSIVRSIAEGKIVFEPPLSHWQVQPASVDVRLGREFQSPYSDTKIEIPMDEYQTLMPGECILATTMERIEVPNDLVGRVEGKSSFGRRFLMIHSTAGFIDPGFKGNITLELVNLSRINQVLQVGMCIAQISFQQVDQPVERPYGSIGLDSHYQGQSGVTPSALSWY